MDKEYIFECSSCGEECTVISHTGGVPEICPYCGGDLDNDNNDEDYGDDD